MLNAGGRGHKMRGETQNIVTWYVVFYADSGREWRKQIRHQDRSIFKNSTTNLDDYVTAATQPTSKCIEDCVPTKTIHVFSEQSLWINHMVHSQVMSKTSAFNSHGFYLSTAFEDPIRCL